MRRLSLCGYTPPVRRTSASSHQVQLRWSSDQPGVFKGRFSKDRYRNYKRNKYSNKMTSSDPLTYLWYDVETTGTESRGDRIMQFCAIRTDEELNRIDDTVTELYCLPSPDIVPSFTACMVTGITPAVCAAKGGLRELDFARKLHQLLLERGSTCAVGYNSGNFDDEFLRNLFYRNLFDPYGAEYLNGNSRWDIINVVRATRALSPSCLPFPDVPVTQWDAGLETPELVDDEHLDCMLSEKRWRSASDRGEALQRKQKQSEQKVTGEVQATAPAAADAGTAPTTRPSFRLSDLTAAFGIDHGSAHDAVSDVAATISVAKLIRERNPELFNHCALMRVKTIAHQYLTSSHSTPFLHTSNKLDPQRGCTSLFLPICIDMSNKKLFWCVDLAAVNIDEMLKATGDEILDQLYTLRGQRKFETGLHKIQSNRNPVLVPLTMLSEEAARFIKLDVAACKEKADVIVKHRKELAEKLLHAVQARPFDSSGLDVEFKIYDGFFSNKDKKIAEQLRTAILRRKPNKNPTADNEADGDEQEKNDNGDQSTSDKVNKNKRKKAPASAVTKLIEAEKQLSDVVDKRLPELYFRLKGRNVPEALTAEERVKWQKYCSERQALGRERGGNAKIGDLKEDIDVYHQLVKKSLSGKEVSSLSEKFGWKGAAETVEQLQAWVTAAQNSVNNAKKKK